MIIMNSQFCSVNTISPPASPDPKSFTLHASPKTDFYAAPAHGRFFSGPIVYKALTTGLFKSARLTIILNWSLNFDQGGLLFVVPTTSNPVPDAENSQSAEAHPRWLKAGLQIDDGIPSVGIETCEVWADYSLSSVPPDSTSNGGKTVKATIEFVRKDNVLQVFVHDPTRKRMVREVQWPFMEGGLQKTCWVGAFAARPDAEDEADGSLQVMFENFVVETEEYHSLEF